MTTKAALLQAVRAKCLDCSCYQPSEVRLCPATRCALWPFRLGKDPNPSTTRGFARPAGYTSGPDRVQPARHPESSGSVHCRKYLVHTDRSGPIARRPDGTPRPQARSAPGARSRRWPAMACPRPRSPAMIGIDPKTLRKHYREELDHGHTKANAKVAENLYRKATGDGREGVTAAIFWLKCRAGWKETSVRELTGKDSEPVTVMIQRFGDDGDLTMGRRAHQPDRRPPAGGGHGRLWRPGGRHRHRHRHRSEDAEAALPRTNSTPATSRPTAKVAENLFRKATGDGREAVIAAIFWLKTRARWKETSVHEVAGEVRHSYVIRAPAPAADTSEWLRQCAPRVIEHEPAATLPTGDADMGRRAHQPDPTSRRQVEAMAAYGVPEKDIARVLAIDPKTLRKHYRDELDTGHVKANSRIAESLYRKAMGDGPQSVTACIFWLKTRAHWKETTVQEQTVTNLRHPASFARSSTRADRVAARPSLRHPNRQRSRRRCRSHDGG